MQMIFMVTKEICGAEDNECNLEISDNSFSNSHEDKSFDNGLVFSHVDTYSVMSSEETKRLRDRLRVTINHIP